MVIDFLKSMMYAGLGMQEKMKEFILDLVKKGELNNTQASKLIKEWTTIVDEHSFELPDSVSELIEKTLNKMNLPTKTDIANLNAKIDILAEKIESKK
ncbi:MAG: phasin family protein [Nitrospirae bacterium]|nr:phasin family protein [Nitrospirota bacterium]MBF0542450.1 phasin family protein [Nitrospirota bacterium]